MQRGNVALRTALATVALMAGIACTDSSAGTLPTPSAASPTPKPIVTTSPTVTNEALASVRTYYATLEKAVRDPARNTAALAAMLADQCACREILTVLHNEARRGRHAEYTLTVTEATVPNASETSATVFVTVEQSSGRVVDSSGRTVERITSRTDRLVVDLQRVAARWLVARVSAT